NDFAVRIGDVLTDQRFRHSKADCFIFFFGSEDTFRAQRLDNGLTQVDHAFSMLRRDRNRLAETEFPGLQHSALRAARLSFVGNKNNRLGCAAGNVREGAVVRNDTCPRVYDEQDQVRFVHRRFGLRAHATRQRGRIGIFKTSRVDHIKFEIVKASRMHASVACNARRVIDERKLAPDEAIEKGRLADVGSADNCNREAHVRPLRGGQDADPEPRISSDISSARRRRFSGVASSSVIWVKRVAASANLPSPQADKASASRAEWRSVLVSEVNVSTRWATSAYEP